jgi:hypothetical protein
MFNCKIGVASPEPEHAAYMPATREAWIEDQCSINQHNHRVDILAEIGQGSGRIGENGSGALKPPPPIPDKPSIAVLPCVQNARKFRQKAVAGVFYDPAPVPTDVRIDQFPEMDFEAFVRSLLIGAHQSAVTGNIGSENCR